MNAVTYGMTPAPWLANSVMKQFALDEKESYPLGSRVLHDDFYVDDLLTGATDIETAKKLQKDVIKLLESGGFSLRKCA